MKTDPLLDDYLDAYDIRRTRQAVARAEPERCADAVAEDEAFGKPLPGVPGQCVEPWPVRRYRGAVGDVPSVVLREDDECLVIGAVGRRFGGVICWRAATPGAVRGCDAPRHCRVGSCVVVRDHDDGALLAHQTRLVWTDDGPSDAVEEAMKLALGSGMQRRLDALADRLNG